MDLLNSCETGFVLLFGEYSSVFLEKNVRVYMMLMLAKDRRHGP